MFFILFINFLNNKNAFYALKLDNLLQNTI